MHFEDLNIKGRIVAVDREYLWIAHRLVLLLALEIETRKLRRKTPNLWNLCSVLGLAVNWGREEVGVVPFRHPVIQNAEAVFLWEMFWQGACLWRKKGGTWDDAPMLPKSVFVAWIRSKLRESSGRLREIVIQRASGRLMEVRISGESVRELLTKIAHNLAPIDGKTGRLTTVLRIRDLLHADTDVFHLTAGGAAPDPKDTKSEPGAGQPPRQRAAKKKRGGQVITDWAADARISDMWEQGNYKTRADLARELNMKVPAVKRALDRERKRKRPTD
jgi:hypothetical protein